MTTLATKFDEFTNTSVFSVLRNLTTYLEIAEEVIKEYKQKYPDKMHRINNAFTLLCPVGTPAEVTPSLYRIHCKELIERILNGIPKRKEDRQMATDAEVIACLMETSLKAPLIEDGTLLYAELFHKWFGELPSVEGIPEGEDYLKTQSPSYEGATKDLLNEARRKIMGVRELNYEGLE